MLIPVPTKFRPHRGRPRMRRTTSPPTPPLTPVPLTLLSAYYNWDQDPDHPGEPGEGTGILTLEFSRAIKVSAVNPGVIFVDDTAQAQVRFDATGGTTLLDAVTVQFVLVPIGEPVGWGQRLTAEANNGIVAADDAAPWPGGNRIEFS